MIPYISICHVVLKFETSCGSNKSKLGAPKLGKVSKQVATLLSRIIDTIHDQGLRWDRAL